jgi:hypothetical protein
MMLVSLVVTSEVATAQVSHQTEFQTENLLKAGNSLDREMRAAESKGCLTDEELKKFAARIQRLSNERDRMASLPDFANKYEVTPENLKHARLREPWMSFWGGVDMLSPNEELIDMILRLRRTYDDLLRCRQLPEDSMRWDGGYGGGQLVATSSHVGTNEYDAVTMVQTTHLDDSGSGAGGGINGGYNWSIAHRFVAGVVFDVNFLNDKVQHTFPGGTFIASTVNFTASAQVRAGVLATPYLLLYLQTGVNVANQRLQINFGGPVTDVSQFTPGFAAGFGGEWKPAGLLPANTSLFAAYEHTSWDKARLDRPVAAPLSNYTWQRQSDSVKAGFRIHFGAPPPPPAAYMPVKAPLSK